MTPIERIDATHLPFARLIGVVVTAAEPDRVVAEMPVRPDLCTSGSVLHGGAAMALADTLGAMATIINLPEDAKGTTTIESKTNFLSAAPAGETVRAIAVPIHKGRRTQVWQTCIERADGKLVALVTQTQMVL